MPNWCENRLEVSGSQEALQKFDNAFKGKSPNWGVEGYELFNKTEQEVEELKEKHERAKEKEHRYTFNTFVPVPDEVINTGYSAKTPWTFNTDNLLGLCDKDLWYDGYSWCISHWGTKWDIGDVEVNKSMDSVIEYSFDTAWSPPIEWIEVTAARFPKLVFKLYYFEGGMCFAGLVQYENGKFAKDTQVSYQDTEVAYYDFVLENFDIDIVAIHKEWEEEQ